jgi:hypothetical protein
MGAGTVWQERLAIGAIRRLVEDYLGKALLSPTIGQWRVVVVHSPHEARPYSGCFCLPIGSFAHRTGRTQTSNPRKSEKNSYKLHDTIRLIFVRENKGAQDLLVPRQWGWGVMRTDIHVFDSKGREVRTDFLADELPPPPHPYDFILLEPGRFIGTHMDGKATEFVKSAGDYEFVVEYTSYLSEQYAQDKS